MKALYSLSMRIAYTLTWPLLGLYLHNSHRARVLLQHKEAILLVKTAYSSHQWELPGGGVKHGEDARVSVAREVKEEVGIELDGGKLKHLTRVRIASNSFGWPKKDTELYMYEAVDRTIAIKRPLEIIDAKWFTLSSLPPALNSCVRAALERAPQV